MPRPLNVVLRRGSPAEKSFRSRAGVPGEPPEPLNEVIATGLKPSPAHNLHNYGGKTIAKLVFTNFYVGGSSSWKASDRQNIDQALAAALSDAHLNNVIMQYFSEKPITTTFKPSTVLTGAKPAKFSQGDVEQLVTQLYTQGKLASYDLANTVFDFMLPSGTILTTDAAPTHGGHGGHGQHGAGAPKNPATPEVEDTSLEGLGGYHGSVHPKTGVTLYYAIGVYSEVLADGTENGIVAFDQPWKNIVATFYHELNEARTDADVEDAIRAGNSKNATKFLGWMSKQGEECGDYPMFEVGNNLSLIMKEVPLTTGHATVPVQFQYSNAVNGPEGPIAKHH